MLPMPAPSRQTGVSDGPLYFLSARRIPRLRAWVTFGRSGPLHRLSLCLRRPHFLQQRKGKVPRFRARVTFGRSPKSDQKRCLKPQVSRLPARLGASGNVTVYHAKIRIALITAQRIACGPLIAAAPAYGAVGVRVYRFERLSNRALAAAGGKCMCGPLGRGKFKIMVHRSVEKRPQHCSAAVGCGAILRHVGAAAGIEVQAIRCGTFL